MSSRLNRTSQPPQSGPTTLSESSRYNEYLVPCDGIALEVITTDICRYLGQDASIRPGTYELCNEEGMVLQRGYLITAYRNLTTAMIEDLKADSARWEKEQRAAAESAPGSAGASATRMAPGSDYRESTTHYNRQRQGPTAGFDRYGATSPDAMMDASFPRYPGTGNSGYNGVNSYPGGFSGQGHGQAGYPAASQYPPQAPQYSAPASQMSDRYGSGMGPVGGPPGQGYGGQGEYITGSNYATYGGQPMGPPGRPDYPTAGPQGYGAADAYYSSLPASNFSQLAQPGDVFYGRGPTVGNLVSPPTGYGSLPSDMTNNVSSASRDERGRERERERERDRAHHRDQDRDDRLHRHGRP